MATTNKQQRAWIRELVEIKAQIDALNRRKHQLGQKLGKGTHRSEELPLIRIVVGGGQEGWTISWKAVAEDIAKAYHTDVEKYVVGNRRQTYRRPTVSVQTDTARRLNPNVRRA